MMQQCCKWSQMRDCNIFNGSYQNSSQKKATRSFQLQFLLILTLILPYFNNLFASGETPKDHISMQMVSNESLYVPQQYLSKKCPRPITKTSNLRVFF